MKRRTLFTGAGVIAAAPLLDVPTAAAHGHGSGGGGRGLMTGAEVLAKDNWKALAGQKVGVISNPTGILSDLNHVVDVMHASGKVNVVAVFGPEHGFRGSAQAGGSEGDHVDPRTGIMVYDAYGATADKLVNLYTKSGVETVVFDIQDVGARFYTYIWTMYEAMLAAVRTGARFVVLDRPNPTGGSARGPMLKPGYTSGVGKREIIQQHGMTVGELARIFNAEYLPLDTNGARLKELQVIQVRGWTRDQLYDDTGLTWVMPSPNMPTPDTALLYPGLCLFEATNLSEGRGTTRPFELIGAPYIDYRWAQALQAKKIPGVAFREAYFTPTISKNANVLCGGVQVQITDPSKVEAITAATHMIVEARKLYPGFAWRAENPPGRWIDLLSGSDRFRTMLSADATAEEIVAAWKSETDAWTARRAKYLLYKGAHR
ncbi:exo-beta-N-acetylmuramidase NamZ domain-containing protein [Kribbella sp. NPDC051587]|uniref:exo-beta-N-acetylmuramidase NamZ family protein n=1 Tax=Kribbella sp. NPDC051587 TaxID=3364119 RepID=UPI0037BAF443